MKCSLFIFFLTACLLLDSCVYTFVLLDSNTVLSKTNRAHTGALSRPNKKEKFEAEDTIDRWSYSAALGTGKSKKVVSYQQTRIDLQGVEYQETKKFERYSVQKDSKTFATVHLEVGVEFGVQMIRDAFNESMDHQTHVFISHTQLNINTPQDGKTYSYRKKNGAWIYSAS